MGEFRWRYVRELIAWHLVFVRSRNLVSSGLIQAEIYSNLILRFTFFQKFIFIIGWTNIDGPKCPSWIWRSIIWGAHINISWGIRVWSPESIEFVDYVESCACIGQTPIWGKDFRLQMSFDLAGLWFLWNLHICVQTCICLNSFLFLTPY